LGNAALHDAMDLSLHQPPWSASQLGGTISGIAEIIEAFDWKSGEFDGPHRASAVWRAILRNVFLREAGFGFQQVLLGGKACGELQKKF
jgi:hypothetical protein